MTQHIDKDKYLNARVGAGVRNGLPRRSLPMPGQACDEEWGPWQGAAAAKNGEKAAPKKAIVFCTTSVKEKKDIERETEEAKKAEEAEAASAAMAPISNEQELHQTCWNIAAGQETCVPNEDVALKEQHIGVRVRRGLDMPPRWINMQLDRARRPDEQVPKSPASVGSEAEEEEPLLDQEARGVDIVLNVYDVSKFEPARGVDIVLNVYDVSKFEPTRYNFLLPYFPLWSTAPLIEACDGSTPCSPTSTPPSSSVASSTWACKWETKSGLLEPLRGAAVSVGTSRAVPRCTISARVCQWAQLRCRSNSSTTSSSASKPPGRGAATTSCRTTAYTLQRRHATDWVSVRSQRGRTDWRTSAPQRGRQFGGCQRPRRGRHTCDLHIASAFTSHDWAFEPKLLDASGEVTSTAAKKQRLGRMGPRNVGDGEGLAIRGPAPVSARRFLRPGKCGTLAAVRVLLEAFGSSCSETQAQILQMTQFILNEARDKAEEIDTKALQEESIERLKIEYARKTKQIETQAAIARSTAINRSRLEKIKSRQEMLTKLSEESQAQLVEKLKAQATHKQFITKLIVQGLLMLLEDHVEVRCRKCFLRIAIFKLALVAECLDGAVKEYTEVIKKSTGAAKTCKVSGQLASSRAVRGGGGRQEEKERQPEQHGARKKNQAGQDPRKADEWAGMNPYEQGAAKGEGKGENAAEEAAEARGWPARPNLPWWRGLGLSEGLHHHRQHYRLPARAGHGAGEANDQEAVVHKVMPGSWCGVRKNEGHGVWILNDLKTAVEVGWEVLYPDGALKVGSQGRFLVRLRDEPTILEAAEITDLDSHLKISEGLQDFKARCDSWLRQEEHFIREEEEEGAKREQASRRKAWRLLWQEWACRPLRIAGPPIVAAYIPAICLSVALGAEDIVLKVTLGFAGSAFGLRAFGDYFPRGSCQLGPMASADGEGDITERIMEFQRREYAMLSRLAQREREMTKLGQECAEAFYAFDDNRKDSLRGGYVDPAVNIEITLLRQRLREKDQEISQVREELQNAQFQPNSIQGKKLLDKCQHLMEENAEIARQLSEEKMQVLRIQLAAERRKRLQLRQRSAFLDRYAEQADQENERMEKKITDLGQSLKETRAEIEKQKKEMEEGKSAKRKQREAAPAAAEPAPQVEVPAPAEPPAEAAEAPAKKRKKEKKDKSKQNEQAAAPPPVVEQPPEQEPPAAEDVEKKRRKEKKKDKEKKEKRKEK
eukprot:s2356_g2.t1